MREADPVNHVELRHNAHGHDGVVFSFPYRADIVDAVRSIPGRRFDWQAKEWWAPRAEATAPYVQGVLERFPELEVAPEVTEWLARAVKGWVGRVTAARRAARAGSCSTPIAGELPEELRTLAEERGDRRGCRSRRRSPTAARPRRRADGSARAALRDRACRSAWSPRPRR